MIALLLLLVCADGRPLTADEAVSLALEHSHTIAAAEAGEDKARAEAGEAFLAHFPQLTASAGYTRLDQVPYVEFDTSAFLGGRSNTGGDPCADIDPTTLPAGFTEEMAADFCQMIIGWMTPTGGGATSSRMDMGVQDNYFAKLTLEQVIFAGGALHRARAASRHMLSSSREQVRLARQETAYSAVQGYYGLVMARSAALVTTEALATVEAYVADLQNMVDVGMASRADLLAAKSRESQARLDALRAEHGARVAEMMLKATLGLPADETLELVDADPPTAMGATDQALALQQARASRPDLAALSDSVDAMNQYAAATWATWLPSVVAMGNMNWKNPNYALEQEWYRSADITVAASWNLWDRGQALHRNRATRAQKRQLSAQKELLTEMMAVEVQTAIYSVDEAIAEVEVAEVGLEQAEEALQLEQERFEQGMVNNTELLTAQATAAGAKLSVLQARTRVHITAAALDKALGIDPEETP